MSACFPLFKGATRVATVAGVPLIPVVMLVVGVASLGMVFGVWWFALLVPGWLLMAQVTRTDDRAFRILWLWTATRLANRDHMAVLTGDSEFWGASSYAPCDDGVRSWEGGSRWGG